MPGEEVTQAMTAGLNKLPADNQILVLWTLGRRGDATALPAVVALAKSGAKEVRMEAIRVTPQFTDSSSVPELVRLMNDTDEDIAKAAQDSLAAIERVESVISILNVPLVQSPPVSLEELEERIRTLGDPDTDLGLAERELRESPIYSNRLIGPHGDTTAMQLIFRRDPTYQQLRESRDKLREKRLQTELTREEAAELVKVTNEFRRYKAELMAQEEADIARIRAIMDQHREYAELHLGGKPMVVADMVEFVRHDIRVFGIGVIGVMALLLIISFRQPRWVILPLLTALATSLITMGFLGLAGWQLTVVSSNFLALLLIFVLSLSIHLIVRYRELHVQNPDEEQRYLVRETVRTAESHADP